MPGEARAVRVHAVVAVLAADEDLLVGLADRGPVAARDLAGGVDRVGAAAGREEDRGVGHRRDRGDARGELLGRLVRERRRRCGSRRARASARPRDRRSRRGRGRRCSTRATRCRRGTPCPFESQTRQPSPRTMRTSRSRVAPMLVKPRQKLVMWCQSAFAPRPREPSGGSGSVGIRRVRRRPRRTRRPRRASRPRAAPAASESSLARCSVQERACVMRVLLGDDAAAPRRRPTAACARRSRTLRAAAGRCASEGITAIGPNARLMPQRPTIRRAIAVSCWMSDSAPVVRSPKTISSATRPPSATRMRPSRYFSS